MNFENVGIFLNDMATDINQLRPGAATPPTLAKVIDNGAGSLGVSLTRFAVGDGAQVVFQLSHGWVEGSQIFPHVHWMPDTGLVAGETVSWDMEYFWLNRFGVLQATSQIVSTVFTAPAGGLAAKNHQESDFPALYSPDKTLSSIIGAILTRGAGTYSNLSTIWLLGFDIHIGINKLGKGDEP